MLKAAGNKALHIVSVSLNAAWTCIHTSRWVCRYREWRAGGTIDVRDNVKKSTFLDLQKNRGHQP